MKRPNSPPTQTLLLATRLAKTQNEFGVIVFPGGTHILQQRRLEPVVNFSASFVMLCLYLLPLLDRGRLISWNESLIKLDVVKLPTAKRGFVLLPRRWVVERSFGWMSRFRRLARDYERLPETLAGLHYLAFVILMLKNVAEILA